MNHTRFVVEFVVFCECAPKYVEEVALGACVAQ